MKGSRSEKVVLAAVAVCFILSGFAALLYQTAWVRQFSLVFGTSELAVAAVLSAYMGGLSSGALIAARYVNRITRPVLFYGVLEAGIALSALAVPILLSLTRLFYSQVFGDQADPPSSGGAIQPLFYLFFAFLVLVVPTMLMGATLPLLTKYVVRMDSQIGSRVGFLYAVNTLGAVAGALVAAFLLLPAFGLNGTVWFGAAINFLVFIVAAGIAKSIHHEVAEENRKKNLASQPHNSELAAPGFNDKKSPGKQQWILVVMLLSGAVSFVYEVLWTRLLGHVLGGSIAAFATMLAGFLSGIAIGSAIASRFAKTRDQAAFYFVAVQIGIAVTSMLIYLMLPRFIPDYAGLGENVLFAIGIMLPATIFIGATFPLAVRILAASKSDAAKSSAQVYSWNTVGAIVGATLAAFWLIPWLKYEGSIKLAVFINALLALFVCCFLVEKQKNKALVAIFLTLLVVAVFSPNIPEATLRSSPVNPQPGGDITFYEVGRSATVVVVEENDLFYLRTNGLPEAAARQIGAPPERRSQQLLSVYPVLARPDTESMLVVGLGGGVALEAIPKTVKSVDVIELEPEVFHANQFYAEQRENNPLQDKRVNIIFNDARSALALTNKKYDAIVSQPSHPWTAGASHLYTREFMSLAKQHLNEGGVFLQWMNIGFVDEFLLMGLSATLLDVFSHVRMYQAMPGVIFFLGSDAPLDVERQIARTGRPLSDDVLGYLELGIGSLEDLLVALTMDDESLREFSQDASIITDNNNYMATRSARAADQGTTLNGKSYYELTKRFDPLTKEQGIIAQDFPVAVNYLYISRRLDAMGMHPKAIQLAERLHKEGNTQSFTVAGLGLQSQGARDQSQELLLRALDADPSDEQARYALLQPWFQQLFAGQSMPDNILQEREKLTGTAADVLRGLEAMEAGDMQTLLQMDVALANVPHTALWYSTSVKLRAEWRLQLTNPQYQPRMFNEATTLIDSAISLFLDVQLYLMRIRSTSLAGDVDSALATASNVLNLINNHISVLEMGYQGWISDRSVNLRVRQIREIEQLLVGLNVESELATNRKSQINDSIEKLKQRISSIEAR